MALGRLLVGKTTEGHIHEHCDLTESHGTMVRAEEGPFGLSVESHSQ